jgi:hypothetical protein
MMARGQTMLLFPKIKTAHLCCTLVGFLTSEAAMSCDMLDAQSKFNITLFITIFVIVMLVMVIFTTGTWACMRLLKIQGIPASLVSAATLSIVLALVGLFVIPRFEDVFNDFGAELPAHTLALISTPYLLLLPFLWLGARLILCPVKAIDRAFYLYVSVGESIILAFVLWSIYTPIFKLC